MTIMTEQDARSLRVGSVIKDQQWSYLVISIEEHRFVMLGTRNHIWAIYDYLKPTMYEWAYTYFELVTL
jgi:hypothetical protein